MKELRGAVAVVTGAASGIGRATAEQLAERGAMVVLADIEQAPLDAAAKSLRARGLDALGVQADVTKWESMAALRDAAVAEFGTINIAFLNAGVSGGGAGLGMWEIDLVDWQWGIAVNMWGVIHGIKALVPAIVENGQEGHVVITSSSVGVVAPTPSSPVYNLTKAAGCSLAETLHGQFRSRGLPISASVLVPPGTINTGLFTAERNRQPEYQPEVPRPQGPSFTYEELLDRMNKAGNPRRPVQPAEVATYVVEGIEVDRFWILPDERHEDMRDQFDAIIQARAESMIGRTDPVSYMQKAT
jgi:NAD(P)-dependent dehydrogenase (short-subunit alcohol dehydrogenase family)